VTGRIDRGIIKIGEPIEIIGLRETKNSVVTGVEMSTSNWMKDGRR